MDVVIAEPEVESRRRAGSRAAVINAVLVEAVERSYRDIRPADTAPLQNACQFSAQPALNVAEIVVLLVEPRAVTLVDSTSGLNEG